MYRIRYASRTVVDPRPDALIRSARIKESFTRYERLDDAYRQAVNDTFFGKVVLGIEDEDTEKILVTAQQLNIEAEKMAEQVGKLEQDGWGSKRARQIYVRGLTHG